MINVNVLHGICVLVAVILSSCVKEEVDGGARPPVDGTITLKVVMPGHRDETAIVAPSSRSLGIVPASAGESRITNLRFFIFKDDENRLERYRTVILANDGTSSDSAWNASDRTLQITVSPGPKRIYCVANWSWTPTAEMPLLDDTTVTDTASLLAIKRLHDGIMPGNPPVMSGFLARDIVGNEGGLAIPLARQTARVVIFPMISSTMQLFHARLTIEGVKFARLAKESSLFERYPALSPAGRWNENDFTGTRSVPVTAVKTEDAVAYPVHYHLPENIATSEPAATAMIIKALYNGRITYYTVTLGETATGSVSHALRRNHSYNYYLTIQGSGSPVAITTPGANPAFTNIRCERVEIM
jgi:hypothetical protein